MKGTAEDVTTQVPKQKEDATVPPASHSKDTGPVGSDVRELMHVPASVGPNVQKATPTPLKAEVEKLVPKPEPVDGEVETPMPAPGIPMPTPNEATEEPSATPVEPAPEQPPPATPIRLMLR